MFNISYCYTYLRSSPWCFYKPVFVPVMASEYPTHEITFMEPLNSDALDNIVIAQEYVLYLLIQFVLLSQYINAD